jgi:hypothetical protein
VEGICDMNEEDGKCIQNFSPETRGSTSET